MITASDGPTGMPSPTDPFTLHIGAVVKLSNEQMHLLSRLNRDLRLERGAEGDLEIEGGRGEATEWLNARVFHNLVNWAISERSGLVFEAGTAFVLPNGAMRAPDLAWVRKSRLVKIAIKKKKFQFLPLCPDFVMLVVSAQDRLDTLRLKAAEYLDNGARLCWLLDPVRHRVTILSPGEPELCLENPSSISGEPVLRGYSLRPDSIWVSEFQTH